MTTSRLLPADTVLPWTAITLDQARQTITGWEPLRPGDQWNDEGLMRDIGLGLLDLLDTASTGGPPPATETGAVLLPGMDEPLDRARGRLAGWHFAKEMLSARERSLLYTVEGVLRLVDIHAPRGYAH
jgi:hypothetical protein